MQFPSFETINKRLLVNQRASEKVKLEALKSLARPPLSILLKLLSNPRTGSRLLGLAAIRYGEESVRRDIRVTARRRKKAQC